MFRSMARRLAGAASATVATPGPSPALVEARVRDSHLRPTNVTVEDISGGCGSFYKVTVVSSAFAGKSLVQQHRLVNDVLKEEIALMHGITVITKTE